MSIEKGVSIINGNDTRPSSRSQSPSTRRSVNMEDGQPKRFQNGWSSE